MGSSSKNNKRKETSAIPDINDKNVKFLQGQLQLYSDLAKALELKLDQRNRQVKSLQHELQIQQDAFQDLQSNCDHQVTKIQDLEQTCVARSAKVSQLVQVIAAKKTSEMQETLLEKSLQVADLVQERHKLEQEIVNLEDELAETKVAATKLKQDRDKNNKLLLELSDIVRTLNTIAVEYEKVDTKTGDSESTTSGASSSGSMPMNQPLRNVKRKIQAIEQDRQRLVRERDMLRQENEDKDAQIAALEASFQLLNDKGRCTINGSGEVGDQGDHHQRPSESTTVPPQYDNRVSENLSREVAYDDFVEEKKNDDDMHTPDADWSDKDKYSHHVIYTDMGRSLSVVEEDVSLASSSSSKSESESSKSSLSTVEEPPFPTVDLKEGYPLSREKRIIPRLPQQLSLRCCI
jgi:hypothetical protein